MANDSIKAILCDLDGVLYEGDKPISGAQNQLKELRDLFLPIRFLTNTTARPISEVYSNMLRMGFSLAEEEIISPIQVACEFIKSGGYSVFACVNDLVKPHFIEFDRGDYDYVLIGDVGSKWDFELLNSLFKKIEKGADILALHKNAVGFKGGDRSIDIGVFVAALEYASRKEAIIFGKPNASFFRSALNSLGKFGPSQALMVGDDIYSDIQGAQNLGIKTALVKTGKYSQQAIKKSGIKPDFIIDSFSELHSLI